MSHADLAHTEEELRALRSALIRRINAKATELAALETELDTVDIGIEQIGGNRKGLPARLDE